MRTKPYPPDPLLPNSRTQALKALLALTEPKEQTKPQPQEQTA